MGDTTTGIGDLDWDGAHGDFWVREQQAQDATLRPFIEPILDGAAVANGLDVLDIGCGCGATSLAAGERGATVLGVDVSRAMLSRAGELAAERGLSDVVFTQADAQRHSFAPNSLDAVISRFGVMFFDDPAAAFRNIAGAVRPGGRISYVCWQPAKLNPHISLPMRAIVGAFPDALPKGTPQPPFSMVDPDAVRGLLTGAGFHDVNIEPLVQQLRLGDDADQVLAHYLAQPMARQLLDGQVPAQVAAVTEQIRAGLAENQRADGVYLGSAAWLVTATR